jgi:HEAT repeat protein
MLEKAIFDDMLQDKYNGLIARVFYGLQVFFIFWICISLVTTLQKMTAEIVTPIQTFLQWQVFISLFFGFTGYFTRFWSRKVKFRTMDVFISAWLVAVTGLNVMINYVVSNSGIFTDVFQAWSFTRPITFSVAFINGDFLFFCPVAVVEEITILCLTFYYLLGIKNDHFFKSKYSIVETASRQFKPVPLFNLIRVSQEAIRNHAKEELLRMYERLPYRNDLNLLDNYFMNPLFDAVCDWNKNSKEMGMKILQSYFKSIPEKISTKINEILYTNNYDKKIPVLQLILENKENILRFIKIDVLYDLLLDKDFQVRLLSVKLLSNHPELKNQINIEKISNLLEDPEYQIQAEALQIFVNNKINVDPKLVFAKINHSNQKIRSAAILLLAENGAVDSMNNGSLVELFLNMLNTVEGDSKATIMSALAKIGNFKKYKIPFKLLLKGLYDSEERVRASSAQAISIYLKELQSSPESIEILRNLIDDLQSVDDSIKVQILKILEERWELNPELIVPIILKNLKSRNREVQQISSQIAISLGNKKPQLILKNLLMLEEEVTYLKRGIISETISKIFEKSPNLVKLILIYLDNDNETVRINVASSLGAIYDTFSGEIDIGRIITSMMKEKSTRVKKELIKFISGYGEKQPESIVKEIPNILKILEDEDPLIRISALKMLISLSKLKGVIIPLESIVVLLNDSDPSIRESAIKVIQNIQGMNDEQIRCTFYMMKELLNDNDWSVRNAAIMQ